MYLVNYSFCQIYTQKITQTRAVDCKKLKNLNKNKIMPIPKKKKLKSIITNAK